MEQTLPRLAMPSPKLTLLFWLGLFFLPLLAWIESVGNPVLYLTHEVPVGQLSYVLSKLLGLYGYLFLTLQVIVGLQGYNGRYFRHHLALALATVFSIVGHAGSFILGASLRAKHSTLDTLIPTFSEGFYKGAVSIGVMGAYMLAAAIVGGFLLYRGYRPSRLLHAVGILAAAAGYIHSICIGTETRSWVALLLYGGLTLWMALALAERMIRIKPSSVQ